MSTRTIRITVRGAFDRLTDAQRAELLAHQADHDVAFSAYTEQGHLTYDIRTRPFFTFRFSAAVAEEKDIPAATTKAELDAMAWLDEHGYAYKPLTASATDMSEVPMGARGRRLGH